MDMPPSGWYPDPYGVPGLLRWWDGTTWTEHTHDDQAADVPGGSGPVTMLDASGPATMLDATRAGALPSSGGEEPRATIDRAPPATPAPTTIQSAVGPGQATRVQPAAGAGGPATQPTRIQPPVPEAGAEPTIRHGAAAQGAGPHGGVTQTPAPQNPLPHNPAPYNPATQNTVRQNPVHQNPGGLAPQAAVARDGGRADSIPPGQSDHGTQVLPVPDGLWDSPGGPDGYDDRGSRLGYHRGRRRRRMLLGGLLVGGTAVALALIALAVSKLGSSGAAPAAQQAPPVTTPATAPATPAVTQSPTPAAPPVTAAPGGVKDTVSGLSFALLSAPWATGCPPALSSQQTLTWTAGEQATAGQFANGGQQVTWYGEACSGPLPQQDGYNGVADLEPMAMNLVNQFDGPYYGALNHQRTQLASTPVSVSGHPGWEVKYLETYPNAASMGLPFNSEEGAVVVTDQGAGLPPAVFFVSVPSNLGVSEVDSLVTSLTLTVTQPTAPAPTDTPSFQPSGGQVDGGGGGGGGNGN
jgi:hypothetical protein